MFKLYPDSSNYGNNNLTAVFKDHAKQAQIISHFFKW